MLQLGTPKIYPLCDPLLDPDFNSDLNFLAAGIDAKITSHYKKLKNEDKLGGRKPILTFYDCEKKEAFCVRPIYSNSHHGRSSEDLYSKYLLFNLNSNAEISIPPKVYIKIASFFAEVMSGKEKLIPHSKPDDVCRLVLGLEANAETKSIILCYYPKRKVQWIKLVNALSLQTSFKPQDWEDLFR